MGVGGPKEAKDKTESCMENEHEMGDEACVYFLSFFPLFSLLLPFDGCVIASTTFSPLNKTLQFILLTDFGGFSDDLFLDSSSFRYAT